MAPTYIPSSHRSLNTLPPILPHLLLPTITYLVMFRHTIESRPVRTLFISSPLSYQSYRISVLLTTSPPPTIHTITVPYLPDFYITHSLLSLIIPTSPQHLNLSSRSPSSPDPSHHTHLDVTSSTLKPSLHTPNSPHKTITNTLCTHIYLVSIDCL